MKIALIIHSLGPGGMERVMATIANYLAVEKEVQVDVILCGRKREVFYELDSRIVIHKPSFPFDSAKRNWHTIKTLSYIRATVKKLKPFRIIAFGEQWNNLVLFSAYGMKYPIFISDRSQPNKNLGRFHNFLRDRLYNRASGFIAQTEYASEIAKKNKWNDNIQVIGNPIREIPPDPLIQREKIVLAVGRLIHTKHFDELIKLFHQITAPDWRLVIIGGDAKNQNNLTILKGLVKDLKEESRIFLEGTQNDVDRYYLKSSIFAFPSSSEGFPNVVGEALSAGLPVISFNCVAGPSEMIEDDVNGYLVPVMDFEAFKDKLVYLMKNEEVRNQMSIKAPGTIARFSSKLICERVFIFVAQSRRQLYENSY